MFCYYCSDCAEITRVEENNWLQPAGKPICESTVGEGYVRINVNLVSLACKHGGIDYSEIPILRPPFGMPKSGLISEVVSISNMI